MLLLRVLCFLSATVMGLTHLDKLIHNWAIAACIEFD